MKALILALCLMTSNAFSEDKIILNIGLNPAGSFMATSTKPKGKLTKDGDTFKADKITVSIESFKTGIDLRDEHFWKHLNSQKFSRATLSDLKAQGGKATAMLEVNGINKPINITYKVQGNEVIANFNVKASDYSLPKADYLGVGVSDEIKVDVTMAHN